MTPRERLLAAVAGANARERGEPMDDMDIVKAEAILSDPAVREALVEAVLSGLSEPIFVNGPIFVGTVGSWIPAITGRENVARDDSTVGLALHGGLMQRYCATLSEAIAYVRDRWNDRDCPLRLHDFAVGDDGAPRLADRFVRYLDAQAFSTITSEETDICLHPRGVAGALTCDDCEYGTKRVVRTRYAWPMWAALAKLGKVPASAPTTPRPLLVVLTLAQYRWDWHRAAQVLDLEWHHDGGEAIVLLSLRKLADRYAEGPVARVTWVDKSEAQQMAEMTA